jgi:N-acetylneuraminic acid mutarotase
MGFKKRFRDWYPQPLSNYPTKLKHYSAPIAIVIVATILSASFIVISSNSLFGASVAKTVSVLPLLAGVPDSWVSKASLPSANYSYQAATVNGIIYVFGTAGPFYNQSSSAWYGSSITYAYSPVTNAWSTKTPMPTPRNSFAITACENKIYLIGGLETNRNYTGPNQPPCAVNEVYDPSTNTWTTKAPMPTARSEMQANTVNGEVYIMGGRTQGAYATINVTEIYNPASDSWSTGVPMLYPVASFASAAIDNDIYVIGGEDDLMPQNATVQFNQIYNGATKTWSLGSPIPGTGLDAAAAATSGVFAPERVYVIGGMTGFGVGSDQNYAYDPVSNSWTSAAPLPTAVFGPAVAVVNDVLYVMGGGQGITGLPTNEQYIPIGYTQTSSSPSTSPSETSEPISQTQLAEYIGLTAIVIAAIAVVVVYIFKKRTKRMVKKQRLLMLSSRTKNNEPVT